MTYSLFVLVVLVVPLYYTFIFFFFFFFLKRIKDKVRGTTSTTGTNLAIFIGIGRI